MKRYKGSVSKLYREEFKNTIYGYLNKFDDKKYDTIKWDAIKCYVFQRLFQRLFNYYHSFDNLDLDVFNIQISGKNKDVLNFNVIGKKYYLEVIDKKICLIEKVDRSDDNEFFISRESKAFGGISKTFIFAFKDVCKVFEKNYDKEIKRHHWWKKRNREYQQYKSENNLNEFVVRYLIHNEKPYQKWYYLVNMLKKHLSYNERRQFQYDFSNGRLEKITLKVLKERLEELYPLTDINEWWVNKYGYWRLIGVYKNLIETSNLYTPHQQYKDSQT